MKKKTRRSQAAYPALDPHLNLKTRSDLLDMDYIDQLSDKDKQWLNDFSAEFVNVDFKTNIDEGRKRIHKKKKVEHEKNDHLRKLLADFLLKIKEFINVLMESQVSTSSKSKIKKSLVKFKKQLKSEIKGEFKYIMDYYKKASSDANNDRNRCIITRQKAQGINRSLDAISEKVLAKTDFEDEMINKIDTERFENND